MRLLLLRNTIQDSQIKLAGKEFSYLSKVLRLKVDDQITARDPQSNFWLLTIETIESTYITARAVAIEKPVETTDSLPKAPIEELWLFQGITKEKKLEQIVRQATEIGALKIVPFKSAFSSPGNYRKERLVAMVDQAIQQSGSAVPTTLENPIEFKDIIKLWNNRGPLVFFHQEPSDTAPLKDIVHKQPVALIIGSEGGLSEEECQFLLYNGATQAYLKTNILRAETAAVYAMGIIQNLQSENSLTTIKTC